MLFGLSLAVLLLLVSSTAGKPCTCSSLLPTGLKVNCSSLNLMELPRLPADTTELHVQDNQLTSVSPGMFDTLVGLKKASLSGNPFHCDCRIQYLRNWLLKNKAVVSEEPICASPSSVAHIAISELSDDFFSSCGPTSCTDGTHDTLLGVMLCCLIVLLLWSLKLAKKSTITLYIDERHSGFEAESLQSLKPKHRRRLHTDYLNYTTDLEKPPLNMELLPQVMDVLHKKHNIKIKTT
ncbi:glycoprotein IX (platelet) [Cheilinus undulatus]|uniref:glycoprotein IX (platelet) n=1 Tax=Cheilinus undulatus TaxID=241271 RepID=UPI001BD59ADF|nr:glycoprotein IX (platelet) [Cheilinus undulatus]